MYQPYNVPQGLLAHACKSCSSRACKKVCGKHKDWSDKPMKRLTTTVTYRVPGGFFCNHVMQKTTPETRCRFCTDVGKGTMVCVLHNEPLMVKGIQIYKASACMRKEGTVVDAPVAKPVELMKHAIVTYRRIYVKLRKQGLPDEFADKQAQEEVLKGDC